MVTTYYRLCSVSFNVDAMADFVGTTTQGNSYFHSDDGVGGVEVS